MRTPGVFFSVLGGGSPRMSRAARKKAEDGARRAAEIPGNLMKFPFRIFRESDSRERKKLSRFGKSEGKFPGFKRFAVAPAPWSAPGPGPFGPGSLHSARAITDLLNGKLTIPSKSSARSRSPEERKKSDQRKTIFRVSKAKPFPCDVSLDN